MRLAALSALVLTQQAAANNPAADPAAISHAAGASVTAITEGLFRVQIGQKKDERATYQVVNRRAPVPKFTKKTAGSALTVSTALATVTVDPSSATPVTFECSAAAAGSAGGKWSWQPKLDANADPLQADMPINRHGQYVMDDSDTARLGGGDAHSVDWWQHPLKLPGPPPTPSPLPPADTCASPQKGVDVIAGATPYWQYPNGLANATTQAACCAACNKLNGGGSCGNSACTACENGRCSRWAPNNGCVAWVYDPGAKQCWAFSAVAGVTNTSGRNRVFGGVDVWPPKPPPPPPTPTDLYLFCYGASGAAGFQRGMSQFTIVTGRAPLMPLAAYGVWYSGCCISDLYNQSAVSDVILTPYRERDLPLDFFVFDFFWKRPRAGWGGYSWDTTHFPDWQKMLDGFRDGTSAYGSPIKTSVSKNVYQKQVFIFQMMNVAEQPPSEWLCDHEGQRGQLRRLRQGDGPRPVGQPRLHLRLLRSSVHDGVAGPVSQPGDGLPVGGLLVHLARLLQRRRE